jgi:putative oxidoreductase
MAERDDVSMKRHGRRAFLTTGGVIGGLINPELLAAEPQPARGRGPEKKEEAEEEVAPPEDLMREHGVLKRVLLVYEEAAHRIDRMFRRTVRTHASSAVNLIRLMFALVVVSEGVQKFLFPQQLRPGRFARIGIPFPDVMVPFVGIVEVVCGALILIGAGTRLAAIPLLTDSSVAMLSTKMPIRLGRGFCGFQLPKLDSYAWWSMLHEARRDMSMWLALVFVLAVGAGTLAIDARLTAPDDMTPGRRR